jgi:NAD(P) transhydrogenase subunit alpha
MDVGIPRIGVPAETRPGERRVAATPDTVRRLKKLGYEVHVEAGAGDAASFSDAQYEAAGATIVDETEACWSYADIILKVRAPAQIPDSDLHEADLLREGAVLISLIHPAQNSELLERLALRQATVLGLDCVPRISRAQSVDVLSSMAAIAGYRGVIEAANQFGRFFGMQMTAAGSTPPCEVMVIGAGVAGLSAIATASKMGAQVKAFDVRPAVREEIQSLGAKFLELDFSEEGAAGSGGYAKVMSDEFIAAEMAMFRREIPTADIVVTTAAIPGKPSPKLILEDMVEAMRPGSVIVDLAAQGGGNCELTEPEKVVERHGVKIVGYTNLTSRLPGHASEYFGRNLANLLKLLGPAEEFALDEEDAVVRGMLVMRDGELTWPPPVIEPSPTAVSDSSSDSATSDSNAEPETSSETIEQDSPRPPTNSAKAAIADRPKKSAVTGISLALAAALMGVIGIFAPPSFVQHFTVFVLACFVGWQLVWNVSASLHTPLMSVTNAISGIIIVGGILQAAAGGDARVAWLAAGAILVASINIFGGFLVTQRMLKMFRADGPARAAREGK